MPMNITANSHFEHGSAPAGALATALIAFLVPAHFPYQAASSRTRVRLREKLTRNSFARLDIVGALLLLAASILLVFGFEEAGSRYPWSSPAVLSALIIGGILLVVFVSWEKIVAGERFAQEPVFPLRLMKDRRFVAMSM